MGCPGSPNALHNQDLPKLQIQTPSMRGGRLFSLRCTWPLTSCQVRYVATLVRDNFLAMGIRKTAAKTIKRLGWDVGNASAKTFDAELRKTIDAVRPYTLTSPERLAATIDATRYISRFNIPGAVVECGVWKGGSSMAMALTLMQNDDLRDLDLFDTFDGRSEPTSDDLDIFGSSAKEQMESNPKEGTEIWAYAPLDAVKNNLGSTNYPQDKVHFVPGKVEDTIPDAAPDQIALLRLDTDWYDSTKHELEHLISRVSPNGVLLIDDYGHWEGARKAVDEWLATTTRPALLARTDYTGRMCVLP